MTDTIRSADGVLGRDQGRRRAGADQHAAVDRALSGDPRRFPRPRAHRLQGAAARRRAAAARPPACAGGVRRRRTEAPDGTLDFAAELDAGEPRPTAPASPDECAFWLYSSGSTGQPKGVRHAHASLKYTADTYGAQVLGIEPDDLVFSAAKLFFAYGLGNAMTFPMSVGATSVLYAGRPTPDAVFDVFAKFRPTVFCGVPTLYAALDAKLEAGAAKIEHRLRRCISAGEALPEEVGAKWARVSGCRHSRRRRLDRDAAHLPLQPAGRRRLWNLGRRRARLRPQAGRRERRGGRRRRDRRIAGERRIRRDGLFRPPRAEPLDLRGPLDAHRRQIREAAPAAATATAGAPTTCSR